MATRNSTAAILALITILGIGLGLYEWSQVGRVHAAVASVDNAHAKLQDRLLIASTRFDELNAKLADAISQRAAQAAAVTAARQNAPVIVPDLTGNGSRGKHQLIYATFFSRLNLSAEKIDQLSAILEDPGGGETQNNVMIGALRNIGIDTDTDPVLTNLMRDAAWVESGLAAAVTAVIGEDGYRALREFRDTSPEGPAHFTIRGVRGNQNLPPEDKMTADQEEKLFRIFADTSQPNYAAGASLPGGPNQIQISDEMLRRAAEFLPAKTLQRVEAQALSQRASLAVNLAKAQKIRAAIRQLPGTDIESGSNPPPQ